MKLHVYGKRGQNSPPDGVIDELKGNKRYHRLLVYKRRLTDAEVAQYDMDYILSVDNRILSEGGGRC